jgi:uncharacterized membrane protein
MIRRSMRAFRWPAAGALALAYPLLAHYTTLAPSGRDAGLALALLPLLALALVGAWRSSRRCLFLALCLSAIALLAEGWQSLRDHFGWMYFIQHAGAHTALLLLFGISLAPGNAPLCSRLAALAHGELAPEVARYTRQVTLAWAIYFGAAVLASTLLFFLAPLEIWSIFANFLSPAALATMFLAEYAVRLRVLPRMRHSSIFASARGFWHASGKNAAEPQASLAERDAASAPRACPATVD